MLRIIDTDAHPPFLPVDIDYIGTLTPGLFFSRLKRAKIQTAAGTLLPPSEALGMKQDTILRINETAMQMAETFPDRYIPVSDTFFCSLAKTEYGVKNYGKSQKIIQQEDYI